MPYKVICVDGGYKVESSQGVTLSKKPLRKKVAIKQMKAVYMKEFGKKK